MISKRLTKIQKDEIVEAYRAGEETNTLAEKYSCTSNTINRTVKTLLSDKEYSFLKGERSKISNKKRELDNNETEKYQKNLELQDSLFVEKENVDKEDKSPEIDRDLCDFYIKKEESLTSIDTSDSLDEVATISQNNKDHPNSVNKDFENNFEEIVPLDSNFDFNSEIQKSDFEIHNYESLPESVYMIVDKKVELDSQLISDLPEWSFLPDNELKRNAILLFSNQRSAKRSCSRNQRVIKIPNTKIFEISKSYLVSKGITRLILEDIIIALDN